MVRQGNVSPLDNQRSAISPEKRELAKEWLVFYVMELVGAIAGGIYLIVHTLDHPARPAMGLVIAVGLAVQQALQVVRIYFAKASAEGRLERIATLAEANFATWIVITVLYGVILSMS